MRTRALAVLALLALGADLNTVSAQRIPLPRIGRRTPPPPNDPEPMPAPVARQLAVTRSRWAIDGYSMISSMRVPDANGVSSTIGFGGGTRGEYRLNDYFAATAEMTATTNSGSTAVTETAELGTRYRPTPHDPEIRPYVDLRGGFMHMYDLYTSTIGGVAGVGAPGPGTDLFSTNRYSRGFGGVLGTGMEISLSNATALSTGISAMRNRMTVYRVSSPESVPAGSGYWLTSYRFTIGLRYNWIHTQHLDQQRREAQR